MSYLDHGSATEKVNAVVGVGALHALLGAGLLVGLAVNVAPDPVPDPIIVHLQKPKDAVQPDPLPLPPTTLEDIRITTVEPVIDYLDLPVPADPQPLPADPLAAGTDGPAAGGAGQVVVLPKAPVRLAAVPRGATVGLRTDDYPEGARRAGEAGRVSIRVQIGADGSVKGCEVTASSGHERLDRRTCEVAQRRWRFSPATEDGVAVPSQQQRSVLWRLEDLR